MIADPSDRPALAERLMKPEEVADLVGVKPKTVTDWARAGRIPFTRTPGRQYRFRGADVEALLNDPGADLASEIAALNESGPARC
ncbi:helix-turn-helix domain-containing protein [Streptosporangium sp. NPDC002544]|uniref:helix-turn-helix domain-containing protein n=1 Tax=Streptosporangium sp. NPDC002544 TaxID=3154538 RepID=UPI00332C0715